jgi:hypothetical protein
VRCPGLPNAPCGHPLDQTKVIVYKNRGDKNPSTAWPEWSRCDEQCEHGGIPRMRAGSAVWEARNRHPVETRCVDHHAETEGLPWRGGCPNCPGTGHVLRCATCADAEQQ